MIQKRRDNKNRVLHEGETQRKDGRYCFKYRDNDGMEKYEYSWRLDKNDSAPAGKRRDVSLREKERQIQEHLQLGLSSAGDKMTVLQLVQSYIQTKNNVRNSTRKGYKTVINFLKSDSFGKKIISKVNLVEVQAWLVKLQKAGKGYSTIHTIRGVLNPAFRNAKRAHLIQDNPFDFELADVVVNDSVRRESITKDEERKFLKFIREDKHFSKYYEGVYILFKTGLRISEFTGLTRDDLDFKENTITIDHQLQRTSEMEYVIEEPKTKSGIRRIPMEKDVADCFRKILESRGTPKVEPVIGGRKGFLYLDKNGKPLVALHWEKYFQHIVEKYNKIYKAQLPKITPHVCRHTFCSNMAKAGMNPKTLQYLMGHSDISVTLNTYTHIKYEDAKAEVLRIQKEENMA